MDSNWIAAIAALISTVVITVTALAAFRQLRHYRNANDIVVYLRLIDRMDSPEIRTARDLLREMHARSLAEPDWYERLAASREGLPEMWPIVEMLRFLEHISVLVIKGEIAENLILAEYAELLLEIWEQSRGSIVARRAQLGPFTGRAFEHLAMRSKQYIDSGTMAREYERLARDPQSPRV